MPDHRKNLMIVGCAVIGCIVTLITCGTLIGNIQGDVRGLVKQADTIEADVKTLSTNQTDMKEKQAFLEGVVSTKLDSIQASVSKMEKQVDDLIRVP